MRTAEPTTIPQTSTIAAPTDVASPVEVVGEGSGQTLLRVLQRYVWLIILVTLGFTLCGLYYASKQRRVYTAQALTALNVDRTNGLSLEELNTALPGGTEADLRLETEVRVLQSDLLGMDVIKQLNLANDPDFHAAQPGAPTNASQEALLGIWRSALQVKVVPKTKLIQISFSSHNPQTAANAVNALLTAYSVESQRSRLRATEDASQSLGVELRGAKARAEQAETKLAEYQRSVGIVMLPGEANGQNARLSRLQDLNRAYTLAQVARIEKQAAYEQMQTNDPSALAGMNPGSALATLRSERAGIARQVAEVDAQFGSEYPKSKQLHSALRQMDASIDAETKRTATQLQQDYLSALNTENRLRRELDAAKAEDFQVSSGSAQLQLLQQDATNARQLYENLLRRLSEANAVAGLQQSNMQVVDTARVPSSPSSKGRSVYVGSAFIAGLFLSLALALVLNAMSDVVTTSAEVQELTGLNVLGGIPNLRGKKGEDYNAAQVTYRRPRSRASEAFHAIRSSLLLPHVDQAPQVIAVASAGAGEGKSVLAQNLAVVLAQRGAKVLLVDADLRCPMQHVYAGIDREPGLTSLLSGSVAPALCLHRFQEDLSLDILPAGPPSPQPADLLDSVAMADFLAQCRLDYDYVVLDTPPTLVVSDLSILAKLSDGVLLVTRSGVTTRRELLKAVALLRSQGEPILGAILNEDPELSRASRRTARYFTYYEEAK